MTQQTLSELKIELGAMRQKLAELEARQDNATPAHTTRRRAFPKGGRFGLLPWVAGIAMITGLAYAAGEALFVDASGNVGIGTTQPQAQLDVVGEIKATGSLGAVSFVARNDPKLIWQWSAVDRTATLRMFGGSGSKVVLPGTVTVAKLEVNGDLEATSATLSSATVAGQDVTKSIQTLQNKIDRLADKVNTNYNSIRAEPQLILAFDKCPFGMKSLGLVGLILADSDKSKGGHFRGGGSFGTGWSWTHPILCGR